MGLLRVSLFKKDGPFSENYTTGVHTIDIITDTLLISRAAAGQMGALSRIVLLCPPPSNIMEVKKQKQTKKHPIIGVKIEL